VRLLPLGLLVARVACAGEPERLGHTTLIPRHSSPDDAGMYTAQIDPANGYAYFVGNYLFKLDITGNLPVQVGPSINCGQAAESAIDPAAGYLYLARTTLKRFALGTGTNAVSAAGALPLVAGNANCVVLDTGDPDPANHYAYVVCTTSGSPAKVAKVALGTFTELGSISLNAAETIFIFGSVVDVHKGYAYFVSAPNAAGTAVPEVVKVKLTSGTNLPVRIGAVNLDTVGRFIDGASIDTVHGYAYYGTYDSDTNIPGMVYKLKLEEGDVPPAVVGKMSLKPGEGRLSASVLDPVNGYVYFANDNTYPGGVYQLSLNGTNLPIEINYLQFQGGTSPTNPPNGITASNTTTNNDGLLPYGEVFIRSAVFDPLHGFAYLGQDSRPNQVMKVSLAQIDPFSLARPQILAGGAFQFAFSNIAGAMFTAWATTNVTLPTTNWSDLGGVSELAPGSFQFTDPQATDQGQQFYRVVGP
jgi:hypothetical protein